MKNKLLVLVYFAASFLGLLQAQRPAADTHRERYERVQAAKIGFITEKVSLSEEEAQKFWPIYNDYQQNRGKIYHEIRKRIRTGKSAGISSEEKSKLLDETMALKEQELALQKNFKTKILTIISIDQYLDLVSAEKEFNTILMERLGKQKKPD